MSVKLSKNNKKKPIVEIAETSVKKPIKISAKKANIRMPKIVMSIVESLFFVKG